MIYKLRFLLSTIGLCICSIVAARTYYVSPSGNNNNSGTQTAPWATWDKAFSSAVAGDTVYFRGGIYYKPNADSYFIRNNGTVSDHIVFANYPGEKPILDCGNYRPTTSYNEPVYVYEKSYIDLIGLTVRNVLQPGGDFGNGIKGFYFYNGNEVRAINCVAHNVSGIGFISNWSTSGGAGKHYFINCDAYNIIDTLSAAGYVAGRGTGFRCSALGETLPSGETYFINCRAWKCSDQGFSLIFDAHSYAIGCWSFRNGYHVDGLSGESGEGNGFKLGEAEIESSNLKRTVTNCIAAYNQLSGFTTNDNHADVVAHMNIYNNISYKNGGVEHAGYGFYILDPDGTSETDERERRIFKNNISYANGGSDVFLAQGAFYTHESNSWDKQITITNTDFLSVDSTGLSGPRKQDGSLPDINFLKLAPGSKLIDAGVEVGLPFSGSAPDLGYFETTSGSVPLNPVFISASVENATPARVDMTYNLSLANIVPAASAFAVRVNSVARTVSSVAISGTRVQLTLSSPVVYGDAVTVAYTKPSANPLQTAAGGQAASISAQNVTNNIAAPSAPVFISASVENATPARVDMTYNLSLANIVPAASAFAVRVNSVARTVSSVAISGTRVQLTLSSPVVYGDAVTVAYTKPSANPLQTAAGGQAASLTTQNVTNNIAAPSAPVFSSASVENATPARVDMTYNLSLANIVPAASAFAVRVNSVARTVSSVAISGTRVQLTLSSPVVYGDAVTVAYTKPSANPLQTAAGGQAASISARIVTNNVLPVNNPPSVNISSPTKSTSYVAPATITIDAVASDPDGTVVKVEFYQGTTRLGEVGSAPYQFTWKNVPAGTYSITAAATDNQNQRTVSSAVTVVVEKSATGVNQLPVIKIVSPSKGNRKYKKGESVTITADATDPDGSISKVEFKSGSLVLAEASTAPYSFTYEPADTGIIVITASATDNNGAISVSEGLQLMIGFSSDNYSEYVNLYPNPSEGRFTVEAGQEIPGGSLILRIVNLSGSVVQDVVMNDQDRRQDFDITSSPAGGYILMLLNGDRIVATKKLLKR